METKTVNSKSIMLKNGLYLGLTSVALAIVFYVLGISFSLSWLSSILGFAAIVLFIVWGIKQFKTENQGFLTIGQALKIGVGIAVVSAIISVVYTFVFQTFIEPDFINQAFEAQREKMAENGMELQEEQLENMKEMMTQPSMQVLSYVGTILASAFFGLIISLIAGAVMQKKEQTF